MCEPKTPARDKFIDDCMSLGASEAEAHRIWPLHWLINALIALGWTAEQISMYAHSVEQSIMKGQGDG